jgi:hypothetical protein
MRNRENPQNLIEKLSLMSEKKFCFPNTIAKSNDPNPRGSLV